MMQDLNELTPTNCLAHFLFAEEYKAVILWLELPVPVRQEFLDKFKHLSDDERADGLKFLNENPEYFNKWKKREIRFASARGEAMLESFPENDPILEVH